MPVPRFALVLMLAVGLASPLGLAAPQAHAGAETPSAVVTRVNDALLDAMRNAETLGFRGRFERLRPLLSTAFNFPLMARVSVGRHWRDLSKDERARLIEAFGRSSIGTFAARFDGYGGERFEVVGEEPGPRGAVLVRNRLVKGDGEAVAIDYLLRRADEAWKVVDVYLDAKYSELAMKRAEYSSVVAKEGVDALIRRLEDKLAGQAAEG